MAPFGIISLDTLIIQQLQQLLDYNVVIRFNEHVFNDLDACIDHIHVKTHTFLFSKSGVTQAFEVLGLEYFEVYHLLKPSTYLGFQYFMNLIDDYSCYCTIYLSRKKLDVFV